jgi:hypothetical protein
MIWHNHVRVHNAAVCLLNRENLSLDNCRDLAVPQPLGTEMCAIELGVKIDESFPAFSLVIMGC